ncbi:ATP synthase subunit D [Colletotrichum higginsianum IMI 349063]|uniref:ATP synthase subunit D n=1 Tax=Colletotrichum higginsianum (strain IMI 349063) TaxID=759273 RepID=A0A1B7YA51_COLHI|nr:ATP synthase subunit D [Colletotrichum higginsianum IMI 349063]OBR08926.1 ATP synthase subunit D [Colletotrichum higginsianum IMI 349063]
MSGAPDREAVFPTRQSLGIMKAKLKGAETGHSLLKRKSEALTKYVLREAWNRICDSEVRSPDLSPKNDADEGIALQKR